MSNPKTKLHEVLREPTGPAETTVIAEPTDATPIETTLTEEGSEWKQPLEDKQNEQTEPDEDDPEPRTITETTKLFEMMNLDKTVSDYQHQYNMEVLNLLIQIRDNTAVKRRKIEQAVRPDFVTVVTNKFPDDLKKLLNFQVVDDGTVLIHPLQYLGKETFAKIARIVSQELNGSYVSDGKNSHWTVTE